jgi:hypothetical protein
MSDEEKLNPVQFGRLIQSVETLSMEIRTLKTDIESLKDTRSKGWGILTGVTLAAGGLGSLSHSLIEKLLK